MAFLRRRPSSAASSTGLLWEPLGVVMQCLTMGLQQCFNSFVPKKRDTALTHAIKVAGGPSALAKAVGVSPQAVCLWKRVPALRVLAVEAATNGVVPRHRLRPDLYPA